MSTSGNKIQKAMDYVRDIYDSDHSMTLIVAACIAVGVLMMSLVVIDQRDWQRFSVENRCRLVAHISGSTFNTVGISSNGQAVVGVGSTSDKNGYACDDGITYYR